jgi:hypothetical protein
LLRYARGEQGRSWILSRLAQVLIFCFLFYQEKRENQTRTIERRFTNEYYQTKPFNSFHEILKMNQYFKYQKKNISFNA